MASNSSINLIEWNRQGRFYDNALDLFYKTQQSPSIPPRLKSRLFHRISAVYNELGVVKEEKQYFDSAIYYANKSLAISIPNQFTDHQITSYIELGSIHKALKNFSQSTLYLKQALKKCENFNHDMYVNALRNLGAVYIEMNELDSAILYLNRTISQPILVNNYVLKTDIYRSLKRVYQLSGDSINYLKAALQQEKYRALAIQEQLDNEINELAISYEAQRKDDLLAQKAQEIQQEKLIQRISFVTSILLGVIAITFISFYWFTRKKNKKLTVLNQENYFLTQEANHRIKNNLQLVTSLINRGLKKSTNPNELIELSNKINAIATLHQQLYLKDSKENIDLKEYVENLVHTVVKSSNANHISFQIEVASIDLPIDKATYLGLLLNELITNSVKHAFTNSVSQADKQIQIYIVNAANSFELRYTDNGVGLKENQNPSLIQLLLRQIQAINLPTGTNGYQLKVSIPK